MYYEPDTIWGRTIEGDHEVAKPSSVLSIVQRRVLQQLREPRSFTVLAARHDHPAPKLEHELIRLADLKLVAFQRPGMQQPRTAPRIQLSMPEGAPVMREPWRPPLPVYLAAVAMGIAMVLLVTT